jgi:AraC-like DNA-binding protein
VSTLDFLADALASAPAADLDEAAFLQRAVDAIEGAHGAVRVEALARSLGVSPGTLRRRFRVLGAPVKRFAEVVRFRHAHAYLRTTPGATWTDVVHRFGYADQSHFVRAYRRLSGTAPTRWDPAERAIDLRLGIEEVATPWNGSPA